MLWRALERRKRLAVLRRILRSNTIFLKFGVTLLHVPNTLAEACYAAKPEGAFRKPVPSSFDIQMSWHFF